MKTRLLSLLILSLLLNCSNNQNASIPVECDEKLELIAKKVDTVLINQNFANAKKIDLIKNIMGQTNFKNSGFDLYMRIDCADPQPQLLHIDLKHQFAIQSEIALDSNNNIKDMTVILREIENSNGHQLNTYDLIDAKYMGKKMVNGKPQHDFEIVINKSTVSTAETKFKVKNIKGVALKKGEIIDIHIKGNGIPPINAFTRFGQQFCKSIVIEP